MRVPYAVVFLVAMGAIFVFSGALLTTLASVRFAIPPGFLSAAFVVLLGFLCLLVLRYLMLLWFSYLAHLDDDAGGDTAAPLPSITIVVPAYNEGVVITGSIRSLLELDYPRFEIVVVDDGSTDDTHARANALSGDHGRARVRVIRKQNGGKASALNAGIRAARSDLVLCMDGDTVLHGGSLRAAVRHFAEPSVGAVAGNVKVVNRGSMLTRLQALEYVEGLNMVRRAQGFVRLVNIIPGPLGLFRRDALEGVGGYDDDTFAEDCDLTLKLLRRGWRIHYEPDAVAYTEAPEELFDLLKQRYRWTRGILQAMRKHRASLVNPVPSAAVTATLWYMVFEGIAWPVMNVFAHILFLFVTWSVGDPTPIVFWFVQLTVLDMAAALYCVASEEEEMSLVLYAIHYRLFFALTIDVAKCFATLEELLRLRMSWGKLQRIGRI